jgi:hypothetical protein
MAQRKMRMDEAANPRRWEYRRKVLISSSPRSSDGHSRIVVEF